MPDYYINNQQLTDLIDLIAGPLNKNYLSSKNNYNNIIKEVKDSLLEALPGQYFAAVASIPQSLRSEAFKEINDFIFKNHKKITKRLNYNSLNPVFDLEINLFLKKCNLPYQECNLSQLLSCVEYTQTHFQTNRYAILNQINISDFNLSGLNETPTKYYNFNYFNGKNISFYGYVSSNFNNFYHICHQKVINTNIFLQYLSGHGNQKNINQIIRKTNHYLYQQYGYNPLFSKILSYDYLLFLESIKQIPNFKTNSRKNNFLQHYLIKLNKKLARNNRISTSFNEVKHAIILTSYCLEKYPSLFDNVNHQKQNCLILIDNLKNLIADRYIYIDDKEKLSPLFNTLNPLITAYQISRNINDPNNKNQFKI